MIPGSLRPSFAADEPAADAVLEVDAAFGPALDVADFAADEPGASTPGFDTDLESTEPSPDVVDHDDYQVLEANVQDDDHADPSQDDAPRPHREAGEADPTQLRIKLERQALRWKQGTLITPTNAASSMSNESTKVEPKPLIKKELMPPAPKPLIERASSSMGSQRRWSRRRKT